MDTNVSCLAQDLHEHVALSILVSFARSGTKPGDAGPLQSSSDLRVQRYLSGNEHALRVRQSMDINVPFLAWNVREHVVSLAWSPSEV
jgi:hypothetical protein